MTEVVDLRAVGAALHRHIVELRQRSLCVGSVTLAQMMTDAAAYLENAIAPSFDAPPLPISKAPRWVESMMTLATHRMPLPWRSGNVHDGEKADATYDAWGHEIDLRDVGRVLLDEAGRKIARAIVEAVNTSPGFDREATPRPGADGGLL